MGSFFDKLSRNLQLQIPAFGAITIVGVNFTSVESMITAKSSAFIILTL
ncbi:MAG: hypothetical protein IJZ76_04060 [Lachnospiraceae bacterium]|nr:hypothetical protein [Lachnospiraceae bacterium]